MKVKHIIYSIPVFAFLISCLPIFAGGGNTKYAPRSAKASLGEGSSLRRVKSKAPALHRTPLPFV
jgi:hypothetical protein